jgi:hypothetical protein
VSPSREADTRVSHIIMPPVPRPVRIDLVAGAGDRYRSSRRVSADDQDACPSASLPRSSSRVDREIAEKAIRHDRHRLIRCCDCTRFARVVAGPTVRAGQRILLHVFSPGLLSTLRQASA